MKATGYQKFLKFLERREACPEGLAFARRYSTFPAAWKASERRFDDRYWLLYVLHFEWEVADLSICVLLKGRCPACYSSNAKWRIEKTRLDELVIAAAKKRGWL